MQYRYGVICVTGAEEKWLPGYGFEPSTVRETTVRSTTELPGNTPAAVQHFVKTLNRLHILKLAIE